jgi:hypothetical protein
MNLQKRYELDVLRNKKRGDLKAIKPIRWNKRHLDVHQELRP